MNNKGGAAKKVIIIVAVIVVILAAGAFTYGWICLMPGEMSKDKAIENYFTAISNEDGAMYKNTCYTKKWQDNISSSSGKSMNDIINEVFSYQSGAKYGEVKITATEKLDKEYAKKMTESINSVYGINVSVSNITKVHFKVKTTFDGTTEESGVLTRYCYKSGGKWFFLADPDVIILLNLGE